MVNLWIIVLLDINVASFFENTLQMVKTLIDFESVCENQTGSRIIILDEVLNHFMTIF